MKLCLAACLLLTLIVTFTTAYEDETYEEAIRTLNLFSKLKRVVEERKRALAVKEMQERGLNDLEEKFDCKKEGEACKGLPKCCEDMQCYWPEGYSAKNDGVCVECVKVNRTCQRDDQCCEGMHCEKESTWYLDGTCQSPGVGLSDCVGEGQKCRTDGMCCGTELHCDKDDFYDLDGKCGVYRRSGRCYTNAQCVTECVKKWYQIYGNCT